MTIDTYIASATQKLVQAGIGTARLDVLVLLEDVLGTNRAQLLAHPERELDDAEVRRLDGLVARRAEHEPLAYVRGKVEFYGREFSITADVLVPRPESETMIDMLKALVAQTPRHPESTRSVVPNLFRDPVQNHAAGTQDPQNSLNSSFRWNDNVSGADLQAIESAQEAPIFDKNPKNIEVSEKNQLTSKVFSDLIIGDVGAGSGALGITAALELSGSQVELLEIDPAALLVAEQNVAKYKLELPVLQSDLLAGSQLDHDVLLCNLPYVPDAHTINQAAMSEPRLAIFGGEDGLDVFRSLFKQIAGRTAKPRLILTESLSPQHADLATLAAKHGYQQVAEDDFIQGFGLIS